MARAWCSYSEKRVAEGHLKQRTFENYHSAICHMEEWLGDARVNQLNVKMVKMIANELHERGVPINGTGKRRSLSGSTVRRYLMAMSNMVKFFVRKDWLEANCVLPVLELWEENMTAITLPRPEDVARIMQRSPGMWPQMIEFARATGLRIGEVMTLRRDAIDWQRGTATVIGKGRGLKSKRRTISLQTFGALDILRRVPVHPDCPFVFWQDECSKNRKRFKAGRPYTEDAKSRFAAKMRQTVKYCAKHGIDFKRWRFHDVRHEHAVNWLRAGGGLYALQLRLGHSTIATTEHYLACGYLSEEEALTIRAEASRVLAADISPAIALEQASMRPATASTSSGRRPSPRLRASRGPASRPKSRLERPARPSGA